MTLKVKESMFRLTGKLIRKCMIEACVCVCVCTVYKAGTSCHHIYTANTQNDNAFPLQVDGRHPTCNFLLEVERDETECLRRLREEEEADLSKGQSHADKQRKRCQVRAQNKIARPCVCWVALSVWSGLVGL